ncbi:MAG: hypothetical protein M3373_05185 [Gemmatimonadota bacterium]|nr:hypothetical protein [Gemmatimonadota bacterium]
MRKPKPAAPKAPSASGPRETCAGPEVIVDFTFDRGLLHVAVVNAGDAAAYRVRVAFDKPFHGLGGTCEVSALRMFRLIEFLAPQKRIETFLDTSSAYFARREPTRLTATISFRDAQRRKHTRDITHDLGIYKDIAYVVSPAGSSLPVLATALSPAITAPNEEDRHGHASRPTLHKFQLPR